MKPSYLDIRNVKSANQCLSWWLVHSYLYYVMGEGLITDDEWNTLGKWMLYDWSNVTHPHRVLVDTEIGASSAFYIAEKDYPLIVVNIAWRLSHWSYHCNKRKKLALRKRPSFT